MNQLAGEIYERVRDVVARTFGIERACITPEAGVGILEEWDSLGHLVLMLEVEREFNVRFTADEIGAPQNVTEMCELLGALTRRLGHGGP